MNLSIQNIYQSKLASIQSRLPENVKINNSFASVLNNEISKQDSTTSVSVDSSTDKTSISDTLTQFMKYNNTLSGNNIFSNSSDSSGFSLPNYNSNIALSMALSKALKNNETQK